MGEAVMVFLLVGMIPIGVVISGAAAAVALGSILNAERKAAHEGNELLGLNR